MITKFNCGCRFISETPNQLPHVEWCPLHAAAEELLTACRAVEQRMRYHLIHMSPWGARLLDKLNEAIAHAEDNPA